MLFSGKQYGLVGVCFVPDKLDFFFYNFFFDTNAVRKQSINIIAGLLNQSDFLLSF